LDADNLQHGEMILKKTAHRNNKQTIETLEATCNIMVFFIYLQLGAEELKRKPTRVA
jgi:hypothetical protein